MDNKLSGRTIDRPALLDRMNRFKFSLINGPRRSILAGYRRISRTPVMGPMFARITRQVIGAQLHAVKVEVNSYCNQTCRTCYIPDGHTDFDRDLFVSIMEEIHGLKINVEIIGGEPLMRSDIVDLVHAAKYVGKSPRVSLYTNATLVTPELAQRLKENGLDAAIVTLHSHLPELHDGITLQNGSWAKTVEGANALRNAGIKIYVATVVHRENLATIKDTSAFVENEMQGSAIFTKYIPDQPDSPFMLTAKEWREFRRWMIKEQKVEHMKEVESFFSLTGSCPSGNYIVAVKADGTVQPCPFATGFSLGNLKEKSLLQIYHDRFNLESFRTLKQIPNACKDCVLNHLCGGGCRSSSYGVYDGFCGKDPLCGGPYSEYPKDEEVLESLPIHF